MTTVSCTERGLADSYAGSLIFFSRLKNKRLPYIKKKIITMFVVRIVKVVIYAIITVISILFIVGIISIFIGFIGSFIKYIKEKWNQGKKKQPLMKEMRL